MKVDCMERAAFSKLLIDLHATLCVNPQTECAEVCCCVSPLALYVRGQDDLDTGP